MSKHRVDPEKLANELAGASAFFRQASPAEPTPPVTPVQPAPTPEESSESDVMTSRRHSVTTPPETPRPSAGLDINRPTTSRDSLRLSIDETKALDELRAALKWDHDLAVSKNDICRAALHLLLEDFHSRGDKSQAVARLKRKQTSR